MSSILPEECTRYCENNLCYKCGKPGHLARNCCAKDKKSTASNNKSTLGCTSLDNEIKEITSELEHICLEDDKSSSLSSSRIEVFVTELFTHDLYLLAAADLIICTCWSADQLSHVFVFADFYLLVFGIC